MLLNLLGAVVALAAGVAVLIVLCVCSARATGCKRVHPMQAGQPAPCAGQLLPASDAAAAGKCIDADLPECRRLLSIMASARKADQERCSRDLASCTQTSETCCNALDEAAHVQREKQPWYASPEFVAPTTAAVAILVAVLLTLAATGDL
jgi:hypothetical protein